MHEEYLEQVKEAQSLSYEVFLQAIFLDDPTNGDFTDPMWVEVLGLIRQKVPERSLYTITVPQAAKRHKCTSQTIRNAIKDGHINAVKDGQWLINEESLNQWVEQWSKVRRAKKKPKKKTTRADKSTQSSEQEATSSVHTSSIDVRFGHEKGARLQLSIDHKMRFDGVQKVARSINEATIDQWSSAAILTSSGKSSRRFFLIKPGGDEEINITHGSLHVRGYYTIEERVYDSEDAYAAWLAYTQQQ